MPFCFPLLQCCLLQALDLLSVLLQVFFAVWDALPSARPALEKLRKTWDGLFPVEALAVIARRLDPASAAAPMFTTPAADATLASMPVNGLQQQYVQVQPQQQQQHPFVSAPLMYQPAPQQQLYQQPAQANGVQLQQLVYAPAPQQVLSYQQPQQLQGIVYQPQPQLQSQPQPQPTYVWQQPQPAGPRPMYSVAQQQQTHQQVQQQQPQPQLQQQVQQQPLRQATPPLAAAATTALPAASTAPPPASDLLSTLLGMGLLSAPIAPAASAPQPSTPPVEQQRPLPSSADMEFTAEKLKVMLDATLHAVSPPSALHVVCYGAVCNSCIVLLCVLWFLCSCF